MGWRAAMFRRESAVIVKPSDRRSLKPMFIYYLFLIIL